MLDWPESRYIPKVPRLEDAPKDGPNDLTILRAYVHAFAEGTLPAESAAPGPIHRRWWRTRATELLQADLGGTVCAALAQMRRGRGAVVRASDREGDASRLDRVLWTLASESASTQGRRSALDLRLQDRWGRAVELVALPSARLSAFPGSGAALPTVGEMATAYTEGFDLRLLVLATGLRRWKKSDARDLTVVGWRTFEEVSDPTTVAQTIRAVAAGAARKGRAVQAGIAIAAATELRGLVEFNRPERVQKRYARQTTRADATAQALAQPEAGAAPTWADGDIGF